MGAKGGALYGLTDESGPKKKEKGIIKINLARRSLSAQRVWVDALYAAAGLFHLAATSERSQQAERQLNARMNRWGISTDLTQASS